MISNKQSSSEKKIRVGISIGDFNGVGLEVIIKTFLDSRLMAWLDGMASVEGVGLKMNEGLFRDLADLSAISFLRLIQ